MVAGSASTRGIAVLLARPSGAAGTVPLDAKLLGIRTNSDKSAAQPGGVEEWSHDGKANDRQHRPEEWSRHSGNEVHIANNAQGW